jgi:phospholipase/lecithinase/hemolysin
MKIHFRSWAAGALLAGLLAACGGGSPDVPGTADPAGAPSSKGSFSALVTFGDSLSDLGTYAPATSLTGNGQAPYFGGKFTVNSATSTIWVENLATTLGITTTAAEVGFAGSSVKCPAAAVAPALATTCTSYGQGGARVTDANGIGKTGGALTVPVKTQIANHLARFTSFKDTDLILIWAGNNDVFVQFGTFAATAQAIQADAAGGKISADEANKQLFLAEQTAQAALKQAAQELAGYIKSQILANGGKYVAVINLPDSSQTPFGATLGTAAPVLSTLVDTFNLWLRDALGGVAVRIIDQNAASKDAYANPAKYGFTNNTSKACDATAIAAITRGAVTDGSSLFCNGTPGAPYNGLATNADPLTWQFADDVHPTPGAHKVISTFIAQQLRSFGWIS